MSFELPPLPYPKDALTPHVSAETLHYHHDKHHRAYVDKLNELTKDGPHASRALEDIVKTAGGTLFDQAAQVWNHTFFWSCMKPGGGGAPTGDLADAIARDFGDFEAFKTAFADAAGEHFGSGWAWLVDDAGTLKVTTTADADTPIRGAARPLLTLDVWEHAYYIDYRNARPEFISSYVDHLVNWDFAAANFRR